MIADVILLVIPVFLIFFAVKKLTEDGDAFFETFFIIGNISMLILMSMIIWHFVDKYVI